MNDRRRCMYALLRWCLGAWVVALVVLGLLMAILTGCTPTKREPLIVTRTETVEVGVPVIQIPEPPPEMVVAVDLPLPVFIAPDNPDATSALDTTGEDRLRALLLELVARDQAWRAWARTDAPKPGDEE